MTKEELKKILHSKTNGVELAKALRSYWNIPEDEMYNQIRTIFKTDQIIEDGTTNTE